METPQNCLALLNQINELLQRAHFDARELQQYAPSASERETVSDQLHRIRMLAMQLKASLSEAMATGA